MNVFEQCPVYQSEHFFIRKMALDDAPGLFECYSNPEAARFFNGDCCNDDFYYTDFQKFLKCVEYWERRYQEKDFVRFTLEDRSRSKISGMVEICPSYKYSADGRKMGILRVDLLPEYENEESYGELLRTLLEKIYDDFEVDSVLTKAQTYAKARRTVLKELHFVAAMDECKIPFRDYFIRF